MFILTSTLLFQLGCGEKSEDTAEVTDTAETSVTATDESPFGNSFTLIDTEGEAGTDAITLSFYSSGDSMSIGGLCNDYFGDVVLDSGVMNFVYGGSTDLECSEEEGQEAGWVIDFLEAGPQYEYDGNILELEGQAATLTPTSGSRSL